WSPRRCSGPSPCASPTAMTLITPPPWRSRPHPHLADEQRAQLAVELARLLRRAAVAAVADHQPGGLGAQALGPQPLDEPVDDLVRLRARPRLDLGVWRGDVVRRAHRL